MGAYSTAVLADAPVIYLQCQETSGSTLTDTGSLHLNATLNGNYSFRNEAVQPFDDLGGYVTLDGTNSYIQLSSTNWFTPATGGYSIEGWIFTRTYTNWARLFDFNNTTTANDMYWALQDNSSLGNFFPVVGGTVYTYGSRPTANTWHHFALTVSSSGSLAIYIDGALWGKASTTAPTNIARQFKYFGKSWSSSDPYLAASLTHLAVYHYPLTPDQVLAHYRAPQQINSYDTSVRSDNPYGFWPLDAASGTSFRDRSKYGTNTMTLTGTLTNYAQAGPITGSKAVTFPNATGTYMRAATIPNTVTPHQPFTYEAWVYLAANPAAVCSIMSHGDATTGTGTNERGLYINTNGTVTFSIYTSNYTTITTASPLTTGAWNHVVASWAPDQTMKIRVNKTTVATGTKALSNSGRGLYIHAGLNAAGGSILVSNAAYYYGCLTDSQTDAHYDQSVQTSLVGISPTLIRTLPAASSVSTYWDASNFDTGTLTSFQYRIDGGTAQNSPNGANPYAFIQSLTNSAHTLEIRATDGTNFSNWSTPASFTSDATLSQHSEILRDNPQHYIPLEETTGSYTSWPQGTQLAAGTATSRTAAPIARNSTYAVTASGTGYAAKLTTNLAGMVGTTSSIECWIRLNSSTAMGSIFALGDTDSTGFILGIGNTSRTNLGRQLFIIRANVQELGTGYYLPDDRSVFHLALVRNGTNITIYVDGMSVGTTTNTINTPAQVFRIASYANDTGTPLSNTVTVDSFALYNYLLTEEQIFRHAQAGTVLTQPTNFKTYNVDSTHIFATSDPIPGATRTEYSIDNGATWLDASSLSYSDIVKADHPGLYWHLGESLGTTATDISSNARNGTYSGAYSLHQTSLLNPAISSPGYSLYLPGPSQGGVSLSAASSPSTGVNSKLLGAEAWINPSAPSGIQHIVGRRNANVAAAATDWSWSLHLNGQNLEAILYPTSGSAVTIATTNNPIQAGITYHVGLTYDGTTIRLYINGACVATLSSTIALAAAANAPLTVGYTDSSTTQFLGYIDEVAIYSYNLSISQMRRHYEAGANGYRCQFSKLTVPTSNSTYQVKMRSSNPFSGPTAASTASTVTTSPNDTLIFLDNFNELGWYGDVGHAEIAPDAYTPFSTSTLQIRNTGSNLTRYGGVYNSSGTRSIYTVPAPADLDASWTYPVIPSAGNSTGFVFRYVSATNFWYWELIPSGSRARFYNPAIGDVYTSPTVGTSAYVPVNGEKLRVIAKGKYIYLYIGNKLVDMREDVMYNPYYTSYRAGIMMDLATNAVMDEFTIYTNPTTDPLASLNGKNAFLYKGRMTHSQDTESYEP